MARIGADTMSVAVISTSIWTCWTSLVLRVINDGAPNDDTSRSENSETRSKTAWRRSRPRAIAAFAPKYTAAMAQRICTRVIPSMTMPTRRMYSVSPTATPWSMMSALRVGRKSEAIDCASWKRTTATRSGQCGFR